MAILQYQELTLLPALRMYPRLGDRQAALGGNLKGPTELWKVVLRGTGN
jgi:hypothetical protein